MKPGTPIPEDTRRSIYERSKGRCEYCGARGEEIHHIVYRSHGGDNNEKNLIHLCRKCHNNIRILQEIAGNPEKYQGRYKW
jgi:5-methylcytosine-specific restriction endonuclease McrA